MILFNLSPSKGNDAKAGFSFDAFLKLAGCLPFVLLLQFRIPHIRHSKISTLSRIDFSSSFYMLRTVQKQMIL
jgi:hypothetical protein